jgi:hypothetical protein
MQVETIKALFTYLTALLIIIGGFLFLYYSRLDVPRNDLIVGAVISVVSATVQFLFNRETQTQTARQVERSTATGAASGATTNITAAPPSNVTVNDGGTIAE